MNNITLKNNNEKEVVAIRKFLKVFLTIGPNIKENTFLLTSLIRKPMFEPPQNQPCTLPTTPYNTVIIPVVTTDLYSLPFPC